MGHRWYSKVLGGKGSLENSNFKKTLENGTEKAGRKKEVG